MKTVLTLAVGANSRLQPPDGAEVVAAAEGEPFEKYLRRLIKQSSGRYIMLCRGEITEGQARDIVERLLKCGYDILPTEAGLAIRSSLIRGADRGDSRFALECGAVMSARSAGAYTECAASECVEFTDRTDELCALIAAFSACKAKLAQEVYKLLFEMLCAELGRYCLSALLALRRGRLSLESMEKLDRALCGEVVLALSVQKRFNLDFKRLRQKGYKIGALAALKYKKRL